MAPKKKVVEKKRAMKAIKEMKACGFPMEKTQHILKELLKTYEDNWDFIENSNYSVLVELLISSDDTEDSTWKKSDPENDDEGDDDIGVNLCRKRRKVDGGAADALNMDPMPSTDLIPRADHSLDLKGKRVALDAPNGTIVCSDSLPLYRFPRVREKPDCPVGYAEKKKKNGISLKNDGRSSDHSGSPAIVQPISVIPPSTLSEDEDLESRPKFMTTDTNGTGLHIPTHGCSNNGISDRGSFEIASSSNGNVKLFLSWDNREDNFRLQKFNTILKMVEDECLKSYKVIEPKFSLLDVLTQICQTSLQLGQETDKRNSVHHGIDDITKGHELVKIPVAYCRHAGNPPSFMYISHNIVYQNGHVNFLLARIGDEDCCTDCSGDCLSASIPCSCARETSGEFAYEVGGLLKKKFFDNYMASIHSPKNHHFTYCKDCPLERSKNEDAPEPCKGHLVRKFIKECWVKCGCHRQCGNRVVQRGITRNLQVFFTGETKGWGLRTLEEIPRGAFVCEYIGEVLTNNELYDRTMKITKNAAHTYPVLLDADWGSEGILKDEEALCLDATFYGNVGRFVNHRCCDANLIEIPVEIETADHHYYHLAFFTTRKVEILEELNWDYGIDFDDRTHPVKSFACRCGSKYCRDMARQTRSKGKALVIGRPLG